MKYRVWSIREKKVITAATGGIGWPDYCEIRMRPNGELVVEAEYGLQTLSRDLYRTELCSNFIADNGMEIYEGDKIRDEWDEEYHYGYGSSPEENTQHCKRELVIKFEDGKFNIPPKWREHHSLTNFTRKIIGHVD